ncbi:MAG: phenylalanine--tRNA ligase subunit alpha [Candidatus Shikimatogenerans sp. Tcar]|uniref:phenylalanine--tRNA ligase n=1 Tax=Candidatus Shikimatogenerans sp. Tcar TaxID=3158565 RepID=A0AAU7QSI5_9FLAO
MCNIILNKYYFKYIKLYKEKKKYLLINKYKFMKKKLILLLKNNINNNNKKKIGKLINFFKIKNNKLKKKKNIYKNFKFNKFNLILRKNYNNIGNIHIINIILNKIINIFLKLDYSIYEDYEIKNIWENFLSLNIKKNHIIISDHDTFFVNKNKILRTHITSFYNNFFKKNKKIPIKIISFGKVYRNETLSKKSNKMFYQLDGIYIDKNIKYKYFLNTIFFFLKNIFNNIPFRIRNSYFPFTNLSIEVDVYYNNKWIEILGGGILNSKILKNFNINNNKYKGFAFGIGIERILMIKYNIKDIRLLYNNDIFFLKKFNIF